MMASFEQDGVRVASSFVAATAAEPPLTIQAEFSTRDPGPELPLATRLAFAFKALVQAVADQVVDEDEAESPEGEASVYYHEGTDFVHLGELRQQLVMLPEFDVRPPPAGMSTADVGEPGENTAAEIAQLRSILNKHQAAFMSS
jgi:hypothetical protein